MKKYLQHLFPLLFAVFLLHSVYFLPIQTYAHPGRTDENGGHTDSETGDYHYHHGYPEHEHYDMDGDGKRDCPYDFDDKTDHSTKSDYDNSGSSEQTSNNGSSMFSPPTPTESLKKFLTGSPFLSALLAFATWSYIKLTKSIYSKSRGRFVYMLIALPFWLLFLICGLCSIQPDSIITYDSFEQCALFIVVILFPVCVSLYTWYDEIKAFDYKTFFRHFFWHFMDYLLGMLVVLVLLSVLPFCIYFLVSDYLSEANSILQWVLLTLMAYILIRLIEWLMKKISSK